MFAQRKLENIYCILKLPYKLKKGEENKIL